MPSITGTPGNDTLYGTAGADEIHGLAGNDRIYGGGAEGDLLYGEEGDDTFIAVWGTIYGGPGTDTLYAPLYSSVNNMWKNAYTVEGGFLYTYYNNVTRSTGYVHGNSIEIFHGSGERDFVSMTLPHSFTFYGSLGSDFFYRVAGGSARNYYYGEEGDDIFDESAGPYGDYYDGGVGNDYFRVYGGYDSIVVGGEGFDTLDMDLSGLYLQSNTLDLSTGSIVWRTPYEGSQYKTFTFSGIEEFTFDFVGGAPGFTVLGTNGDDVIQIGGTGNEANFGGFRQDHIDGGAGDDTLIGFESGSSSITAHWLSGGVGDDTVVGGHGDDRLYGDDGDDVLLGGRDNDLLNGGGGFDIASYDDAASGVTVSLAIAGQQDTGVTGRDTLVDIEALAGSDFNDTLTGNGADNLFWGGLGDDTINGGGGRDTASYSDAAGAVVIDLRLTGQQAAGAAGRDTLQGIENLYGSVHADTLIGDALGNDLFGGGGGDTLRGLDGDDRLEGGAGDDRIEGGLGNDILAGGDGVDTVSYLSAAGAVTVNLSLTTAQNTGEGMDTFSGFEVLLGSAFDDVLTGGDADEVFEGGLGDDRITGGSGRDIASYASVTAAVTVNLGVHTAQNTGGGGTDTLAGVEGVRGGDFNDVLTGDGGDNVIEGGLGNDTLVGGGGIDTVSFEHSKKTVNFDLALTTAQNTGAGSGTDTISGFENIIGSMYTDALYGDDRANFIDGRGGGFDGSQSGGDYLNGRGGDDILVLGDHGTARGGDGDDIVYGSIDADNLYGDAGDDFIFGGAESDILFGGTGVNVLVGEAGNDTLWGYGSADQLDYMYGGVGNDEYIVDCSLTGPQVLVDEGEGNAAFAGGAGDIDRIKLQGEFFWDYYSVGEELVILRYVDGHGSQVVGGKNVMNKTITGWVGDDIILTYGRSSVVDAREGTDYISFGLLGLDESYDGVNTLIMRPGSGMDYLYDFESGVDKVDLSAFAYGLSGAQWKSFLVDVENGDNDYCFLYLGAPGQYLVFVGMTSSQLSAWDFIGG